MRERQAAAAMNRGQVGNSFSEAVSALMRELPGARDLRAGIGDGQAAARAGVNVLDKILYC